MLKNQQMFVTLKRLWKQIPRGRRGQFYFLILLMVFTSLAEVFSIGAVVPFLGILTAPEKYAVDPNVLRILEAFSINESGHLVLIFTMLFGFAAVIAAGCRLLLLWAINRISFMTGADLSFRMYQKTLYQPYEVHLARNSGDIISALVLQANELIFGAIMPVINIVSSFILLSIVLVILLYIDPITTFCSLGVASGIYLILVYLVKKRLSIEGEKISRESSNLVKSIQEGLGGVRDILIDSSQEIYAKIYQRADLVLRIAQSNRAFIGQSPKYLMELLGMMVISISAYYLSLKPGGLSPAVPFLGALALGAQRLLPVLQQMYVSWSTIQGSLASVNGGIALLEQSINLANQLNKEDISFKNKIVMKNLWFKYKQADSNWVLEHVNAEIVKGDRVGIIGKTGSGKSTLLDLLLGLLVPSKGEILIDGMLLTDSNRHSWQKHIAHVPQVIFLADSTIAENIAFGVPEAEIDYEKVALVAHRSQLDEVIEGLPNKYRTKIGERGGRLSGGQRQRIGIARALYKNADIIIFDEATSALDNQTELAVMETINALGNDVTIIMTAHRHGTLKDCSKIFELNEKQLNQVKTTL